MIDLVTWKYDEGTWVKFPTTVSYRKRGHVRVGDHPEDAPHMTAIKVETVETPEYMKGRL